MDPSKRKPVVENFNLSPWEASPQAPGQRQPQANRMTLKQRIATNFSRIIPAHRRYFGLSRRIACIIAVTIFVAILILIIGLAAGLSQRNSDDHKSLPLGSQTYSGDLTYYGPGLGACGKTSSSSDNIVSISHIVFDAVSKGSDPNANPLCGHKLRIIRNDKSLDLTVADRCTGCKATDLDVSPGAFKRLADPDLGRVLMTWAWIPPVPST